MPKHPLFFLKRPLKGTRLKKWIFGSGIEGATDKDRDLLEKMEDDDTKAERKLVYGLDPSGYYKYPLVIKDLRKVY